MDQLFNILWTLLLYGAIFGILWWMLSSISTKVARLQPFMDWAWIVWTVAVGCVGIALILGRLHIVPFLTFGSLG